MEKIGIPQIGGILDIDCGGGINIVRHWLAATALK